MKVDASGHGTWTFRHTQEPLVQLTRRHAFAKPQATLDTMATHWLFALATITDGTMTYQTKTDSFVLTKSYGVFLPKWSVVFGEINCKHQELQSVVSKADAPGIPNQAFVFEPMSDRPFPTSLEEVTYYLSHCKVLHSIEYNPNPSGFGGKIKRTIDSSFRQNLSFAEIARKLKTTSTQLGRSFKSDFGLSPVRYRNYMRIVSGGFELLKGEAVTDVSLKVGFNDHSRFNKQFKEFSGTSPKSFLPRKEKSKNAKS